MPASRNHYGTLGVTPAADDATLRTVYLELMRRYHPDRAGDDANAAEAQAVAAAYAVLRDPARRAAYDAEQLRLIDGAAGKPGHLVAGLPHVRGGAAARNLFLLLAAATAGLAYWGLQQPSGSAGRRSDIASLERPTGNPAASESPLAADPADDVAVPSAVSTTPEPAPAAAAPLPAVAEAPPGPAKSLSAEPAEAPASVQRAVRPARPSSIVIDLAGLERHLQLLTDQSLRVGTDSERERLFTSRDAFDAELDACATDICRRDVYLRRNQEVAEIMRN